MFVYPPERNLTARLIVRTAVFPASKASEAPCTRPSGLPFSEPGGSSRLAAQIVARFLERGMFSDEGDGLLALRWDKQALACMCCVCVSQWMTTGRVQLWACTFVLVWCFQTPI